LFKLEVPMNQSSAILLSSRSLRRTGILLCVLAGLGAAGLLGLAVLGKF
jgi:hypothetical protein